MTGRQWIAIPSLFALGAALLLQGPTRPATAGPAGFDGISGAGTSGFQVVNLDPEQTAEVVIDLYKQGGGAPIILHRSIPAQGTTAVYLPAESGLERGAYAAIARSDRPIDLMLRHDWASSGAAVYENQVGSGTELVLPFAAKQYVGQTSLITVQNTDVAAVAQATMDFYMDNQPAPTASRNLAIAPGASATIDLGKDPFLAGIPAGSTGWLRVTGDRALALSSLVDLETSAKGVYSVEGGPSENLTGRLLSAPFVANAYSGAASAASQTTGISVLNPGDQTASVSLRYAGAAGSCAGMQAQHGPFDLPAKGTVVFYQGNVSGLPTGDSGLPVGCAASALIEASVPVAAVVNSIDLLGASTAAALARPLNQGATMNALPILRSKHTNLAISSLVQAHNPGSQVAQVTLRMKLWNGQDIVCPVACKRTIPAGGAAQWDLAALVDVPENSFGSAWLSSDQPVQASVLETTAVMDGAMYNALPDRHDQEGDAARSRFMPLLLVGTGGSGSGPTRTAAPTALPGSTPVPSNTPRSGPIRSLREDVAATGIQVLNLGTAEGDASLRLQDLRGGAPIQLERPAVPAGVAANVYLPAEASLQNSVYAGLAAVHEQPMDALFRSDWTTLGKAVLSRAPMADVDIVVPLVARYDGISSSYLFVQNSDPEHAANITLDLRVAEGQAEGRRSLALSLAAGGATMIDMSRHPALQELIADRSSWTGWVRLTSDRPVAALALSDLERSAGAYVVPGLAPAQLGTRLAAPMLFRRMPQNPGMVDGGVLDSAIHVVNPNPQPAIVELRYRVSFGGPVGCPGGQEIAHGEEPQTLAPGELRLFHQHLATGIESGLPEGCAASAIITASAPVAAVVDIGNDRGLVAAYPAEPATLASANLHLTMVRREQTGLMLTTLIQVQNPGDQPVTASLRVFKSNGMLMDCPTDCLVTLAAGASHVWDPRQIQEWDPNSYGSARIEADGPVTAVVLDDSTNHKVDLAAYMGLKDSGRQVAPLPMLPRGLSLASLPEPDLAEVTLAVLSISSRPPRAEAGRLTTPIRLACGSIPLRRATIHLVYDAGWLNFDETDADGDAVPDAVSARLPSGARLAVSQERSGREGRLTLTIDAASDSLLTGGIDIGVTLRQVGLPDEGAFGFGFDPKKPAELLDTHGRPVTPEIAGKGWRPGSFHAVYLPLLPRTSAR